MAAIHSDAFKRDSALDVAAMVLGAWIAARGRQFPHPARINPLARLWPQKQTGEIMPAPDPFGLIYDETSDGAPRVIAEVWPSHGWFPGNPRNRLKRQRAVYLNIRRNGWCCPWCGGFVPIYRRADAVFCSTSCRRKAAYQRRKVEGMT